MKATGDVTAWPHSRHVPAPWSRRSMTISFGEGTASLSIRLRIDTRCLWSRS